MYQFKSHKGNYKEKGVSSDTPNAIALQRKCENCEEEEDAIQAKFDGGVVIQRVACQGTDHDTSPEHAAIENEYVTRVQNSAKEYELPRGSVLTYEDSGLHRTGYADIANVGAREIYDIKRASEGYPEAQLARYILSANAYCGQGWTRGTNYGGPRRIPFNSQEEISAYQDGDGVISYIKLPKGQQGLKSFLKAKSTDEADEDMDGYGYDEWLGDQQMMKVMEQAGMVNDSEPGPVFT